MSNNKSLVLTILVEQWLTMPLQMIRVAFHYQMIVHLNKVQVGLSIRWLLCAWWIESKKSLISHIRPKSVLLQQLSPKLEECWSSCLFKMEFYLFVWYVDKSKQICWVWLWEKDTENMSSVLVHLIIKIQWQKCVKN